MLQSLKSLKIFLLLAVLTLWALPPAPAASASEHGKARPAKTAILLVTFGTSVPQAQKVFGLIETAVRKAYPGVEVRWAYTAKFIRDKLAKKGQKLLSPAQALALLMAQGYTQTAVQSLHVIPGAEYNDLLRVVRGFKGMSDHFRLMAGRPLCSTTDDLKAVVAALASQPPKERKDSQAVVYMGHGTHHPAGVVYPALDYMLQSKDPLTFLGTVEGYPTLEDVKAELLARDVKEAYLLPFMTVAGDHAHNDMAGDEAGSWKTVLTKAGVKCIPVMKAITENPKIVAIWLDHLRVVMAHFK